MRNQEIFGSVKAAVDGATRLSEQYTWQSAAVSGKDAATIGPVLSQMAINELLRAELMEVALVSLGYHVKSVTPPRGRILMGRNVEEMLRHDRKVVTENIGLYGNVLAHNPENMNGCPVRELFEELRKEEQEELVLLDALLNRSGESQEKSPSSFAPS